MRSRLSRGSSLNHRSLVSLPRGSRRSGLNSLGLRNVMKRFTGVLVLLLMVAVSALASSDKASQAAVSERRGSAKLAAGLHHGLQLLSPGLPAEAYGPDLPCAYEYVRFLAAASYVHQGEIADECRQTAGSADRLRAGVGHRSIQLHRAAAGQQERQADAQTEPDPDSLADLRRGVGLDAAHGRGHRARSSWRPFRKRPSR